MSKAQELLRNRKRQGIETEDRQFFQVEGAGTLEDYYEGILDDNDIEKALNEYQGNYDKITEEFIERTRLQGADIPFLFAAIALQCARIYIINRLTKIEKANSHGGKEDAIHDFQEKVLGKFGKGTDATVTPLYASLDTIITTRGVPYDAQTPFNDEIKKLHLFKGANHRFSTLGHDPILGLIFGTSNILTSTITTNRKVIPHTNEVVYDSFIKNPKVGVSVPTMAMFEAASKRLEDDKKSVAAALIKQLLHTASDMYTTKGIQLPGAGLILSNTNVEKLTSYISTGDVAKIGASAGLSALINVLISAIHGSKLLYEDDGKEYSRELYQARTRKIVLYSNCIASASNLITSAVSQDVTKLDIGGLLITISRLFSDIRFMTKLEYEFINSGVSKIYDEKYAELSMYF